MKDSPCRPENSDSSCNGLVNAVIEHARTLNARVLAKAPACSYSCRMESISIRAVILASLAVLGVDILSSVVLTQLFGGPGFDSELTDEQIRAASLALLQDVRYLTLGLFLGTASTVLGGYLAARLANSVPYWNALAFGVLGLLISMIGSGDLPTWFKVVGLLLTLPAALLGGHLAKLRTSRPVS
jgi:hypothetical protein